MKMDRYEKENTAFAIDGYFTRRPHETEDLPAFQRAKHEAIMNIKRRIELINGMTLEQFQSQMRR